MMLFVFISVEPDCLWSGLLYRVFGNGLKPVVMKWIDATHLPAPNSAPNNHSEAVNHD